MIHRKNSPQSPPPELDNRPFRESLETAGLRCTAQRMAVFEELRRAEAHPTAEEVFHAVRARMPKISLATVYKSLEALVAVGVAYRLTTGDGTQAARYDARCDHHYHFRCLQTGAVHDLPTRFDPELIAKLDPSLPGYLDHQGFRLTGYRLELLGYQTDRRGSIPVTSDVPEEQHIGGEKDR